MFILDEETGNSFSISKEALNTITDHRLKMPKPKDIQAYTLSGDGKKVPNIALTTSLEHVQRECFFQMIEHMKREMQHTFQKYNDVETNINDFKCGKLKITRSVHIGFWKLLTEFQSKNERFSIEDLSRVELKDCDQFDMRVVAAEIKPRIALVIPAEYSKAQLERNNTRD